MPFRILVIDDDGNDVEVIADSYRGDDDFIVLPAYSGVEGLRRAQQEQPDAVVLDIMMPGMDGNEVMRRLKANSTTKQIPIIVFSKLGDNAQQRIQGWIADVDYYIPKSQNLSELRTVVEQAIRRAKTRQGAHPISLVLDGHTLAILDAPATEIVLDGHHHTLSRREAQLLKLLISLPGAAFSVRTIATEFYKVDDASARRDVFRIVGRLRKHIEPHPSSPIFLITVGHGHGYRLAEAEPPIGSPKA